MTIIKGDEYRIPFKLKLDNKDIVYYTSAEDINTIDTKTQTNVNAVEITIGNFTKSTNDTTADHVFFKNGYFYFPISQEETYKIGVKKLPVQVRVFWISGDRNSKNVHSIMLSPIDVVDGLSNTIFEVRA